MGNYIVHFDDGSEALAHYGKRGMHWGEWNEETRRRYMEHPDLIGNYAKALETHAYNQSYQDQVKMNPVEAGARNLAVVAGKALSDASHAAELAGRTLASIGDKVLQNGKRLLDTLLGRTPSQEAVRTATDAMKKVGSIAGRGVLTKPTTHTPTSAEILGGGARALGRAALPNKKVVGTVLGATQIKGLAGPVANNKKLSEVMLGKATRTAASGPVRTGIEAANRRKKRSVR